MREREGRVKWMVDVVELGGGGVVVLLQMVLSNLMLSAGAYNKY